MQMKKKISIEIINEPDWRDFQTAYEGMANDKSIRVINIQFSTYITRAEEVHYVAFIEYEYAEPTGEDYKNE